MAINIDKAYLSRILGENIQIASSRSAIGGSINDCKILSLVDGRDLFIKTHSGATVPGMYSAEFKALTLLAKTESLQIPIPYYHDDHILVLESFKEGSSAPDWQEQMGKGLALLHQATQQTRYGFHCDNFLGTTLQINTWQENWLTFWREQRFGFQLSLLREKMDKEDTLLLLGEKLLNKLDQILVCDDEKAVLLHGDLWSGNTAATENGKPIIFDPASYYGHREAEFGMMRLFGGFTKECEDAYQEVWPFQADYERRFDVYRLYHQLNHLNLFGGSYYNGCLATIRSLL
jgi:protein-ribulosamine 3-kinase